MNFRYFQKNPNFLLEYVSLYASEHLKHQAEAERKKALAEAVAEPMDAEPEADEDDACSSMSEYEPDDDEFDREFANFQGLPRNF